MNTTKLRGKRILIILISLITLFCLGYSVYAANVFNDNFNRANDFTIGNDWMEWSGYEGRTELLDNRVKYTDGSRIKHNVTKVNNTILSWSFMTTHLNRYHLWGFEDSAWDYYPFGIYMNDNINYYCIIDESVTCQSGQESFSLSSGVWYNAKFWYNGTASKAKIWQNGTSEPEYQVTWAGPSSDPDYTSLLMVANGKPTYLDDVSLDEIDVGDSCTYSGSGDWEVEISDNCVLNTNTDLSNNKLIFKGASGKVTISAIIKANSWQFTPTTFNGNNIIAMISGGHIEVIK